MKYETKEETHWRKLMSTAHLHADELKKGDNTVTIKSFEYDEVFDSQLKDKARKLVLIFEDIEKPMIVTKLKAKAISKSIGSPLAADWVGKKIVIYSKEEKHFGEKMNVINIRTSKVLDKKPDLLPNTEPWKNAIPYLKGEGTIDKIKEKYSLSKANQTLLENQVMES